MFQIVMILKICNVMYGSWETLQLLQLIVNSLVDKGLIPMLMISVGSNRY